MSTKKPPDPLDPVLQPPGEGIADSVYEAIGMLLRGLLYHEHSGGRTPEHLAGQVRRSIAILSPAIAAEIEQDGAARVYEERWDAPERSADIAIAEDVRLGRTSQQIRDEIIGKVGMMAYSRTPEMQARYDAAVAREQIAVHGPAGSWLFAQNSIAPSTCGHSQIALSNDEVPTLSCQSCGKRWTFVPEGEMPRYCEVDDPKFPGMLDNRGWPNDARVEIRHRTGVKALRTKLVCVVCVSCGQRGGDHEVDCLKARREEREKLQTTCDHRGQTVIRTTGDPPGPPCCGWCGLELPTDLQEESP